jgi:CheY-like chemotaxis protein
METIKLLLANSDRKVNNQVEVAVLDVCYDRAAVESTRAARLDEVVHQGSLWEFDLIVVGVDGLFRDRNQQSCASIEDVARAIETMRAHCSTPIIALTGAASAGTALLNAGADSVLPLPLCPEQLKTELRASLDLNGFVEAEDSGRWSGLDSLVRGLQKAKAVLSFL